MPASLQGTAKTPWLGGLPVHVHEAIVRPLEKVNVWHQIGVTLADTILSLPLSLQGLG